MSSDPKTNLEKLARAALPVTEEDWGSKRQIDAENDFFEQVARVLPKESWDDFEHAIYKYPFKATTEERVAYALQLVKKEVTS